MATSDQCRLALAVRDACLRAAIDAYESAGVSGLCGEGRWEMAVQAIRTPDPGSVIAGIEEPGSAGSGSADADSSEPV